MLQIILLIPALFIFIQGIARLVGGPKSEDETPAIAKRNGIIFTVVGSLMIVFAIGVIPILIGALDVADLFFGGT